MIKALLITFLLSIIIFEVPPEVKVSGAMRNIMMEGDLSAHINLDTIDKTHLYGLGPIANLKGEIMILDGTIYSSTREAKQTINQQDKVNQAAMLVYSKVQKWREIKLQVDIDNYFELEKLIESTAHENGYDTEVPFSFKIEANVDSVSYHIIDWKKGAHHTMENHMQYAYNGQFNKEKLILLGFYSRHHKSIFTHHTTFMHVHLMDKKTKTVGHLFTFKMKGEMIIFFPV